jgi:hypothetical protein
MGGGSNLDDITPRCRLSARKMDLGSAASANTRAQVAVSISSARDSRAIGFEQ